MCKDTPKNAVKTKNSYFWDMLFFRMYVELQHERDSQNR